MAFCHKICIFRPLHPRFMHCKFAMSDKVSYGNLIATAKFSTGFSTFSTGFPQPATIFFHNVFHISTPGNDQFSTGYPQIIHRVFHNRSLNA